MFKVFTKSHQTESPRLIQIGLGFCGIPKDTHIIPQILAESRKIPQNLAKFLRIQQNLTESGIIPQYDDVDILPSSSLFDKSYPEFYGYHNLS